MLTAGVAHGMRNPLAILQHSLDHLKMRLEQAEVDLDRTTLLLDIRGMEVEAQRSLKTLERLVRWARPHGGLPEPTRLQVIIHDLVELISGDLIHMRISLALAIDRNLPCVLLAADPLRMALTDLFWNAAKAMPSGGEIRVTLTESADHRFVVLSVEDSGVGMTESQIQSLFSTNPFEPIPAGGIGLGLYLCKQVLAAQGVTIRAQSELGAGTKVFVDFPVHSVPEEV
jgi:signal transduction histidine kinase